MQIQSEFIMPDASGYSCVIIFRGVMFVINYVNNKLSVGLGPYKRAPSYPKWYHKHNEKRDSLHRDMKFFKSLTKSE